MLLEREGELGRVDALVAAAVAGRGQMLVVEGEAGIGKTALLDEAVRTARERGLRVLHARGGELERESGYGVVRQLFEPAVVRAGAAEQSRLLNGAAARAGALLHVGHALPVPVAPEEDPTFALLHALYWLTDNLAQDAPVLLAVDDAQWADLPSLRFVDHLARRLDGMHVGVVATWRSGEPDAPVSLLDGLRRAPAVEVTGVRPLSEAATRSLVRDRLGAGDEAFCAACHETTGGNPFLLEELLAAMSRGQLEPTADAARRVGGLGAEAITRSVFLRLAQLAPSATRLARAVAVLDLDGDLHRAGALAEVAGAELHETAAALQRARILASDEPLRFVHPILRSAIYDDLTSAERDALHRRAAAILRDHGREDRAAAQLLLTQPAADQEVVAQLAAAAQRAVEEGSTETAVRLLERALTEPARDHRLPLLMRLAARQITLGRPATAALDEAAGLASDPTLRLAIAIQRCIDLGNRRHMREAAETMMRAIDENGAAAPQVMSTARAMHAGSAICTYELAEDGEARIEALVAAENGRLVDAPHLLAAAGFARALGMRGTADEVVPMAEGARLGVLGMAQPDLRTPFGALFGLVLSDRLDDASELIRHLLDAYARAGAPVGLACAISWVGKIALLRGDLEAAHTAQVESLAVAGHEQFMFARPWRVWLIADSLVRLGDLDGADRALVVDGYGEGNPDPEIVSAVMPIRTRARLRMAQGRREEARADALDALALIERRGIVHTTLTADLPLVLAWTGERDRAARLAAAGAAAARRWGVPAVTGAALRVLGSVTGDRDPLREAVDLLDGTYAKLELAEALVEYGAALRRANERQASREPLRRGGELAERCGAAPLAARAREELEATGARARSLLLSGVESLTASERRVAQMAADGMTNTEIAQSLWVTRKTVETHLRHVFQKLDVSSRRELPEALHEPVPA
jgi:DNA-binding CsgD family transcriptional regulator